MYRKLTLALIFLIIAVCAVSAVSAADVNVTASDISEADNILESPIEEDICSEGQIDAKITPINTEIEYKSGSFSFKITDMNDTPIANSEMNLRIEGDSTAYYQNNAMTDENGIATFNYDDLYVINNKNNLSVLERIDAGEYTSILSTDNKLIKLPSNSYTLTVKQAEINMSAPDVISYKTLSSVDVTLTNAKTGLPVTDEAIRFYFKEFDLNGTMYTNSRGIASFPMNDLKAGKYNVYLSIGGDNIKEVNTLVTYTVKKLTIKPTKLTTTYNSGSTFKISVVDNDNKGVGGVKLKLNVYTGTKYKTAYVTTNSKGIASYKPTNLAKGTHKVVISSANSNYEAKSVSSSIKINSKTLKLYSAKYKYSEASMLMIGVGLNSKKPIDNIKVKVQIYTKSKCKTFNLVSGYDKKSKSHGMIYIITNKFTAGTHKVKLTVTSPNYKGSATTKLAISKAAAKTKPKFTAVLTKGKEKYV